MFVAQPISCCLLLLLPFGRCLGLDEHRVRLSSIARKYVITVSCPREFPVWAKCGAINAEKASDEHLREYLPILEGEWNIYPPEFIKRVGLENLLLVDNLRIDTIPTAGVADSFAKTLYLDVGTNFNGDGDKHTCIHHEFFHFIDTATRPSEQDDAWAGLNASDFEYGSGGPSFIVAGDLSATKIDLSITGFLNRYSTSAPREDKAEMFAYMVVCGSEVEARAKSDPIIRAKMWMIKDRLRRFCPQINDQFWQRARLVKRPSVWPLRPDVPLPAQVEQEMPRTTFVWPAVVTSAVILALIVMVLVGYGFGRWKRNLSA